MFSLKANRINYGDIIYEWLDSKKKEVNISLKEQTYLKYLYICEKSIIPEFNNKSFSKMTSKMLEDYFNSNEIKSKSLSSQKIIFYIINASYKYGINHNYKAKINKIDISIKTPKSKIVYLTKSDQHRLEELLYKKDNLMSLGILMCLYTGLRIGELCALRWCDIDLRNKCYVVNHTVQRVKNTDNSLTNKTRIIISEPKTISSKRIVPIPNFLIPLLRKYKNKNDIFVFSEKNIPRDPRTFESYFERSLKKCNIDNINFHALRHTFATRSLEAGMDIKTLSEILGHSSYRITLDIYVHSSFDLKKDSINVLVNYLNKGKHKSYISK